MTFKSVLFIPHKSPQDLFNNYGKRTDLIKMYVRRVFITDNFEDMMPKYLAFVKGVVSKRVHVVRCSTSVGGRPVSFSTLSPPPKKKKKIHAAKQRESFCCFVMLLF